MQGAEYSRLSLDRNPRGSRVRAASERTGTT